MQDMDRIVAVGGSDTSAVTHDAAVQLITAELQKPDVRRPQSTRSLHGLASPRLP